MKLIYKYIIFIILLLFAGCEIREWDNPYDADCPKELFTPGNFIAVQQDSLVKLSWTQVNKHISGFVIERSADGGDWSSVATPTKTDNSWSDSNIAGGTLYQYRLTAKAGNNFSNEVTAQVTAFFASSITTNPITQLLSTAVILGGTITDDGGSPITSRGVCWNTSTNPTISNSKTVNGTGEGAFTSTIAGLNANTIYYVRAYAITNVETTYGNEISFKTYFGEVTDIDGNVYPTVKIGEQIWMAENLAYLPSVSPSSTESYTEPFYYVYGYNGTSVSDAKATSNYKSYGVLYNWPAAMAACPDGWHLPSDDEWKQLEMTIGMSQSEADDSSWRGTNEGVKLKAISEWVSNANGTDDFGFSAFPGGCRYINGNFYYIGHSGYWWSITEYDNSNVWYRALDYDYSGVLRGYHGKETGFSVRCIKGDIVAQIPTVTTNDATNIEITDVTLGGTVTNDGNAIVTERGVVYSTSQNPTTADVKVEIGSGTGSFSNTVAGLTANTTYYFRAYAINSQGTSYGDEITFKTYFGEITDIDGNVYPTVKIGEQIWMAENLKVTKYNDGIAIPNITDNTTWAGLTTGAYCWYNNNEATYSVFGAMYNWSAVNTGKLAPEGWHVPSDSDWQVLLNYLGIEGAGAKLKETGTEYWASPNDEATNETGFSAIAGGYRELNFTAIYNQGYWWSSSEIEKVYGRVWSMVSSTSNLGNQSNLKFLGLSVRCVLGSPVTTKATVITSGISEITTSSVYFVGDVSNDGGTTVSEKGIVYSTSQNPTTADIKVEMGNGTGSFSNSVSGLTANTTYYVRAYAINSVGTAYGEEISFKTYYGEVTDIDGNVYPTVQIGEQIWMAENLKTNKFRNGEDILNLENGWGTATEAAYCYYNNIENNSILFGCMYNWYAVNDVRKIAPEGWHVATDTEWQQMADYLGGVDVAGGKLKEVGTTTWNSPNTGATNESGFNARAGGYRDAQFFRYIGNYPRWWTASETGTYTYWSRSLAFDNGTLNRSQQIEIIGAYVRCILGEIETLPGISTSNPSSISTNSAALGGEVTSDGSATVTERGVVYSTLQNPTTADVKVEMGSGTGSFSNTVSGLTENTTYYIRAYAINSEGTAYGNEVSFTTSTGASLASISLGEVSGITSTNAFISFNITDNGGATITERGICYSTITNPTTDDTKVAEGNGTGYFGKTFTGFVPNTSYFVRAYAINNVGTAYSNEIEFKTMDETGTFVDSRDGNEYKWVKIGEQIWMAENLSYDCGANCFIYDDDFENETLYGRLYYFIGALSSCPNGWHLPTDGEWEELSQFISYDNGGYDKSDDDWFNIGKHLKAISGWNEFEELSGNGTDDYGFRGLPGGTSSGYYYGLGFNGFWWTSTEFSSDYVYDRVLYYGDNNLARAYKPKGSKLSVRCIKD